MKISKFIILTLLIVCLTTMTSASQIAKLDLSQLPESAEVIVLAKVVKVEQKQFDSRIPPPFDEVTIKIASVLKGETGLSYVTLILQPRGVKDFDPALNVGDMGVFFFRELNESEGKLAFFGSIALFQKPNFELVCDVSNLPCPEEVTNTEYKLYSDLLLELRGTYISEELLVIRNLTTLHHLRGEELNSYLKKEFGDALSNDLRESFCCLNVELQMLEDKFESSLNIVLIPREKETEIFNPIGTGWARFYSEYPKAQGIIELSRAAFNKDETKALVYYGTSFDSGKGGIGYYLLLEKIDGKWTIIKKVRAWIA